VTDVRAGEAPRRRVRVAVTRPAGNAEELAALLRAGGADPVILPLTRIVPVADAELRAAAERIADYDWVVFTSVNAVQALARVRGDDAGAIDLEQPRAVAAVGSSTAAAVRALLGWRVDVVPEDFIGAALVPAMMSHGLQPGATVLWPRAEHPREELARGLEVAGATIHAPVAYATRPDPANARELARQVEAGAIDVIVFTAPSAIASYAAATPRGTAVHAVIGPSTADAARAHGLPVHVQPAEHTIAALVRSVFEYLGRIRDRKRPHHGGESPV
jgi:uroporphyrinogen-III synthase